MISYQLALELKHAGFTQFTNSHYQTWNGSEHGEAAPIPTLSELIQALQRENGYIKFNLESAKDPTEWRAELYSYHNCPSERGSTPEEAVARLWLALHVNGDTRS
jgi:hypothetical protein